jgi:hypothetical protein
MGEIYYDLTAFTSPLPCGLVSPTSGYHPASMARLVWAAATIGTTPFGPRLHHGRALELQWREAMMRASVWPGSNTYWRSHGYARLDPSEKGAVSFFLGQAQAKLFAHDFFHVGRFVHYDAYLAHLGRPRRRTRPDFVGFFGRDIAIGVEAKGRSNGFGASLIAKAKRQASSLPVINGHPAAATYVHVARFDRNQWCAHLEDPPRARRPGDGNIDPAILTLVYYLPIVAALRAREPETIRLGGGVPYVRAYFQEVDSYLSVRADIETLIPSGVAAPRTQLDNLKATGTLYELVLSLDASELEQAPSLSGTESLFVGGDGVGVELGTTWADWAEAQDQ